MRTLYTLFLSPYIDRTRGWVRGHFGFLPAISKKSAASDPPVWAIRRPLLFFGMNAVDQKSIFASKYATKSSIFTRSCAIVSRSRMVTQPSASESKSYVMQNGVPISS